MPFSDQHIVLASASPRRRELLKLICSDFDICPSTAEERVHEGLSAEETVKDLSILKACSVDAPDSLVIGADTLVYVEDTPLRKPSDEEDAFRMLRSLSGRAHCVYTGVTVFDAASRRRFTAAECTKVFFCDMTDADILSYIATGEPMDKAGAYGIQGGAAKFISRIEGCYFNVMGLPVHRAYMLLKEACDVRKL